MRTRRPAALLVLAACFNAAGAGTAVPRAHHPGGDGRQAKPLSTAGVASADSDRKQAVYTFAGRALRIEDEYVKVRTLTNLADLLWKYDEPYARQLFYAAGTELRGRDGDPLPTSARKRWLMSVLVGRAARHDVELARTLIRPDEDGAAPVYLQTARTLVRDDPTLAVEFAGRGLNGDTLGEAGSFLFDLRARDRAAADLFFERVMSETAHYDSFDGEELMRLGAYVFTSPGVPSPGNGYEMAPVGGLYVVNLSADRPNISPDVVRTYLRAAVDVITRPTDDPRQQQLYYVTAYQLLPRVRALLPSKLPDLTASMERLARSVPQELTRQSAYKSLAAESYRPDIEVSTAAVDRMHDAAKRDATCLGIAHTYTGVGKFTAALEIAGKVKDDTLRASLVDAINFRKAARSLSMGAGASQVAMEAGAVNRGVLRGILWLGVAQKRINARDLDGATEAIDKALSGARESADPRAPYLIVAAASFYVGVDRQEAMSLLAESVQAFNRSVGGNVDWVEEVRAGGMSREFPLAVDGIATSLDNSIPPLVAADFDGTVSAVMAISNEQALGPALVALTNATLKLPSGRVPGKYLATGK